MKSKLKDTKANSKAYFNKESVYSSDELYQPDKRNIDISTISKKTNSRENYDIEKSNLSINSQNLKRFTPNLASDNDIISD